MKYKPKAVDLNAQEPLNITMNSLLIEKSPIDSQV